MYLLLLLLALGAIVLHGQQPITPFRSNAPVEIGLKEPPSCNGRGGDGFTYVPMTAGEKTCWWFSRTFTAPSIAGATFNGLISHLRHSPEEFGLGWQGYGKRVGTRMTQSISKSTAQYLVGLTLREDPRYHKSLSRSFGKRLLHALAFSTVMTRTDSGSMRPTLRIAAGSVASGWVASAWAPDSRNKPSDAWRRSASAFSGSISGAIFKEFSGDFMRLFGGFGGKKTDPAKTNQEQMIR